MTATTVANGYPADWSAISKAIRERSSGRCECEGECGLHRTHPGPRRCSEINGQPAIYARGTVVLTVAHLNHTPQDCRPENLKAMCQRCHLRYDVEHHKKTASNRKRQEREDGGQTALPI